MKLSLAFANLIFVSQAGATILPDAGTVFERPVVNRCISFLIGENHFGEEERRLVIDRIHGLNESTYSRVLLPRLHGFATELPDPPHVHIPEKSRKPSRLTRLLRDLDDPKVDKELHVLKGREAIQRFLDAQAVEQVTLDANAKAHVGSDYKVGRSVLSVARLAGAAGLGYVYTRYFGGEPAIGATIAVTAGLYDTMLLGDRGQYVYRKLVRTPEGEEPSDWRSEQLHAALENVRTWSAGKGRDDWRYFGVTSVIPDSLADALLTANRIEDLDPELFADLYEFRRTNRSRWNRMGDPRANFLSADFIFTPAENPEEQELVVVARLARQYNL